jgi:hypothetical protein
MISSPYNVIWASRYRGSRGGPAGRDGRFPFNRGGFCSNRYCTMWSRLHCWHLVPCERFRYESYVLPRAINTTGCAARVADVNEDCSYETPERRITKLGVRRNRRPTWCAGKTVPRRPANHKTPLGVQGQITTHGDGLHDSPVLVACKLSTDLVVAPNNMVVALSLGSEFLNEFGLVPIRFVYSEFRLDDINQPRSQRGSMNRIE